MELPLFSTDVAQRVQAFYDQHPYPPPIDTLKQYRQLWQDLQRRRADFHVFWPGRRYRENHSILIAGCGTSQAAKHALRWPTAQVIGIDCSATSVQHTARLKQRYGLTNLEIHQLAIERLSDLNMSFDQIVCTGVLHHLADPNSGLSALRAALKPDGAMHLMVYAPYGRTGIYMLQEFCRRIGISCNAEGIRGLLGTLCALPPGHPLQSLLTQAPELQNEAALADALLHPNDRAYAVPQLFELIENAGLTFGRWLRQAPYSARCGVMARIPQAQSITRLPAHDQYAVIELFRGTMSRHSVVLYHKECPSSLYTITCDNDKCLEYVPIRMVDTICVQDQQLNGAAAVLINRTHAYKDLRLLLDQSDKQLFDAIDGRSTIRQIIKTTSQVSGVNAEVGGARALFEQLWWHDQVVFDTTRAATTNTN